jgi:hypothetical protein
MIAIARLHGGTVEPRFFQHYEAMVKPDHFPIIIERLHVDRARNECVDMLLHPEAPRPPQFPNGVEPRYKDCTHMLFIDDDIIVPPNGLMRLLGHDVPIVGGLYFARTPPHLPVCYRHVVDNHWVPITEFCAGLQECDALGAGFMLIKREVFEKMERPWFDFSDRMGEDMWFCEQAKRLGYTILVDADVKCKHLQVMEVGEDYFQQHKNNGLNFQHIEGYDLAALSSIVKPYRPNRDRLLRVIR